MEIFPAIGRMTTPHYWPEANGKPWVKNQAVTVSHSKLLYQFVVSFEAYPYAKNQHHDSIKTWHILDLILRITFGRLRYACLKSLWACLTIPIWNDWKKLLLLLILYHMQKTNFITQLILKIKLPHYSASLWACPGMPDHTHLKQPTNICCFHGLQITSKNSASTYLWHILV